MRQVRKAKYEAPAAIMKALAHPTRLLIVDALSKGPRCVCELSEIVGDHISTVSRHLSCLKNCGIVAARKQGTQVFYSLRLRCAMQFFKCLEAVLKARTKEEVLAQ